MLQSCLRNVGFVVFFFLQVTKKGGQMKVSASFAQLVEVACLYQNWQKIPKVHKQHRCSLFREVP